VFKIIFLAHVIFDFETPVLDCIHNGKRL